MSVGNKLGPWSSSDGTGISIYVSHLDQMPAIFDQVQQVIINAKKAGE